MDDLGQLAGLTAASLADAIAFVARRPVDNVFLQWLIQDGFGPDVAFQRVVLWRQPDDEVGGVACFSPQLVVAAEDDAALAAFAREAKRRPPSRMIVGPRATVERLWALIESWHRPPTIIRHAQPVYAIDALHLRLKSDVVVRRAERDDLQLVVDNMAAMTLGELGYDPRAGSRDFWGGVENLIERGWVWLWMEGGTLRFLCNIGSRTEQCAQLQGVWTPPEFRGRGYATQALGSICHRLLGEIPILSLYVNDFNRSAIAVYEKLGFRQVATFSSLIFG